MMDQEREMTSLTELVDERESSSNTQTLAETITALDVSTTEAPLQTLITGTQFKMLEYVNIDASDANTDEVMRQYLVPTLRKFHFYGGPISGRFLVEMAEKCPSLEDVLLDNPRQNIDHNNFLAFLQGAKKLKKLTILFGMEYLMSEEVIEAIESKGLEVLGYPSELMFPFQQFNELVTGRMACYEPPAMKELECTTNIHDFTFYASELFPDLRKLTLTIDSDLTSMPKLFTCLAFDFPELEHLTLNFSRSMNPTQTSIDALALQKLVARKKKLTTLEINAPRNLNSTLTDAYVIAISGLLSSDIKTLNLDLTTKLEPLTAKSLIALGRICPNLKKLLLRCRIYRRDFAEVEKAFAGDRELYLQVSNVLENDGKEIAWKEISRWVESWAPGGRVRVMCLDRMNRRPGSPYDILR